MFDTLKSGPCLPIEAKLTPKVGNHFRPTEFPRWGATEHQ
jgi:hypothetical protein